MNLFDLVAPLYERLIRPPDPAVLTELLALPTDGWLLDAGGGTGRVAARLASLTGGVVVSDKSARMLAQARRDHALTTVRAHAEKLPFRDGQFGRILVVDALHHFASAEAAIVELTRTLAPGGRLVIEEPDITQWRIKVLAVAERVALMRSRFLSPERIQSLAAAEGLVSRIERDRTTAWVVADKPVPGGERSESC